MVRCAGFEVNGSAKNERVGILTFRGVCGNASTKSNNVLVRAGCIGGKNVGATASGRNRLVVGAVVGAEAVAVAGISGGNSGGALGNSEGRDS